jgi:hypothetical protein
MANIRFSAAVEEAEETTLAKAAEHKSSAAAAGERRTTAKVANEIAAEHLAAVESSFRASEDTFTDLDHAEAVSAVRRTELAIEGSEAALTRAERSPVNTDARVATLVADHLRDRLAGVTVLGSFARPVSRPRASELPVLLIVQSEATKLNRDGTVSATVEATYLRSALHAPLTFRQLSEAAHNLAGAEVTDNLRTAPDGDGFADRVTVSVKGGHLAMPEIATVAPGNAPWIGSRFAAELALTVRRDGTGVTVDRNTGARVTSHLDVLSHSAEVTGEEIDGDRRTVTVDSLVLVRVRQHPQGRSLTDVYAKVAKSLSGGVEFVSGMGTVERVEVVGDSTLRLADRKASELVGTINPSGVPIPASSLTYGSPEQVVIRTTLVSRVVASEAAAA